jgi:hypothetical protein
MNLMKNILTENAVILDHARPLLDQHPIEIQPYGMIAKLPLLWPEYSHAMPNGFCLGGHSGRPERWRHDGSRWVAAEPSRYGFCVWGYDNDTPEVVRLGVNLSGREVERLADLFLAVEEVALEAEGAAPKTVSVSSRLEEEWSIATSCRLLEGKTTT